MRKYIVVDIETTGLSAVDHRIIEIGAVKIEDNQVIDKFSVLINPMLPIPEFITELTGIKNSDIVGAPTIEKVLPEFVAFAKGYHWIGHNIPFDYSFIKENAERLNLELECYALDTLRLANRFITEPMSKSLTHLIQYYGIERNSAHRAYDDAFATYQLYLMFYDRFYESTAGAFMPEKLVYKRSKPAAPITSSQKNYLNALIAKHQVSFERDVNSLSKSEASQEIDRIIRTMGR